MSWTRIAMITFAPEISFVRIFEVENFYYYETSYIFSTLFCNLLMKLPHIDLNKAHACVILNLLREVFAAAFKEEFKMTQK